MTNARTNQSDLKVAVLTGSSRPGRQSLAVATWVADQASGRGGSTYEIIDIADLDLPFFDEPLPPMAGRYQNDHTKRWAAQVDSFDAFVLVTPEYNHSPSAVLKNSLDYLFAEWNDKAVAFVSYGVDGGVRASEHLRQVCGELKMADVRTSVSLRFGTDFEGYAAFKPHPDRATALARMFDELESWGHALADMRNSRAALATL